MRFSGRHRERDRAVVRDARDQRPQYISELDTQPCADLHGLFAKGGVDPEACELGVHGFVPWGVPPAGTIVPAIAERT